MSKVAKLVSTWKKGKYNESNFYENKIESLNKLRETILKKMNKAKKMNKMDIIRKIKKLKKWIKWKKLDQKEKKKYYLILQL